MACCICCWSCSASRRNCSCCQRCSEVVAGPVSAVRPAPAAAGRVAAVSAARRRSGAAADRPICVLPGALVLVLFGVQLQVEQALQVAGGAAPAAPPPPPPLCRTPPGYRGRWLRRAAGTAAPSVPAPARSCHLAPFSFSAAGPMAATAWSISSTKLLKESPAASIWRAFMRSASDLAWSRSLDCTDDRNAAFSASVPWAPWPLIWFQVAVMISFWRSEIWFC